jgi:hypothetical protein
MTPPKNIPKYTTCIRAVILVSALELNDAELEISYGIYPVPVFLRGHELAHGRFSIYRYNYFFLNVGHDAGTHTVFFITLCEYIVISSNWAYSGKY